MRAMSFIMGIMLIDYIANTEIKRGEFKIPFGIEDAPSRPVELPANVAIVNCGLLRRHPQCPFKGAFCGTATERYTRRAYTCKTVHRTGGTAKEPPASQRGTHPCNASLDRSQSYAA